jgi:hypothetical protein
MGAYRKLGDRRGRLRFEIVGPAWGALETAESHSLRPAGRAAPPTDPAVPPPPRSAERIRATWNDLTGSARSKLSTEAPERAWSVGGTMQTRATVQLLDISVSGALLASSRRFRLGQSAALRATLDGEAFSVDINVQHVSPDVNGVDAPTGCRLGVMFVSHNDRSLACIQRFLGQRSA